MTSAFKFFCLVNTCWKWELNFYHFYFIFYNYSAVNVQIGCRQESSAVTRYTTLANFKSFDFKLLYAVLYPVGCCYIHCVLYVKLELLGLYLRKSDLYTDLPDYWVHFWLLCLLPFICVFKCVFICENSKKIECENNKLKLNFSYWFIFKWFILIQ